MNQAIHQKIASWLEGNFDTATKEEIRSLQANQPDLLEDAFYRNLEFGTGGLRGLMGVGTNRVNKYTIGMATQGFSNYLLKTYPNASISVVVGHDSRNNSRFFAETTAQVFAANGIKVYECTILPQNVLAADEIIVTNAIRGINWIGGYRTKRFQKIYR